MSWTWDKKHHGLKNLFYSHWHPFHNLSKVIWDFSRRIIFISHTFFNLIKINTSLLPIPTIILHHKEYTHFELNHPKNFHLKLNHPKNFHLELNNLKNFHFELNHKKFSLETKPSQEFPLYINITTHFASILVNVHVQNYR